MNRKAKVNTQRIRTGASNTLPDLDINLSAPPCVGKCSHPVIPAMLARGHSIMIVDVKGQVEPIIRSKNGQQTFILNPFGSLPKDLAAKNRRRV
jgi:hypothetical protein